MKRTYIYFVLSFIAFSMTGYGAATYFGFSLHCFYSQKLQMPLFTGYLTLGGFLLSLKTFILIKLKEGLYDNKYYIKLVMDNRVNNPDFSFFGPLTRLGNFLIFSVINALCTSFYQISLGWIKHDLIAAIGLSLAINTAIMVVLAWWYIRGNLNRWFELLEKERVEREKEAKAEISGESLVKES